MTTTLHTLSHHCGLEIYRNQEINAPDPYYTIARNGVPIIVAYGERDALFYLRGYCDSIQFAQSQCEKLCNDCDIPQVDIRTLKDKEPLTHVYGVGYVK